MADDTRPLPPERLDEIREWADKATPGPWEVYDANEGDFPPRPLWCVANDEFHNPTSDEKPAVDISVSFGDRTDADFIAHARQDIPDLLNHITAQAERIAALEASYEWREDPDNLKSAHIIIRDGRLMIKREGVAVAGPVGKWLDMLIDLDQQEALKRRITALEVALKPFAALAEHIFEGEPDDKALIACLAEPDDDPDLPVFTIGDVRRAHKALKGD